MSYPLNQPLLVPRYCILVDAEGNPDSNAAAALAGTAGGGTLDTGRVAAANPAVPLEGLSGQRGITVMNTDPSLTIYVGGVPGVNANNGFPLPPGGGNVPLDFSGTVYFFAATGAPYAKYIRTAN